MDTLLCEMVFLHARDLTNMSVDPEHEVVPEHADDEDDDVREDDDDEIEDDDEDEIEDDED